MYTLTLDSLDGAEVQSGIFLIGEPSPIAGTNKMRALANVRGLLCVVELKVSFVAAGMHEKK